MTSPCSVILIFPLWQTEGKLIIALFDLPPPLLIDPPRPWNNLKSICFSLQIFAKFS